MMPIPSSSLSVSTQPTAKDYRPTAEKVINSLLLPHADEGLAVRPSRWKLWHLSGDDWAFTIVAAAPDPRISCRRAVAVEYNLTNNTPSLLFGAQNTTAGPARGCVGCAQLGRRARLRCACVHVVFRGVGAAEEPFPRGSKERQPHQ